MMFALFLSDYLFLLTVLATFFPPVIAFPFPLGELQIFPSLQMISFRPLPTSPSFSRKVPWRLFNFVSSRLIRPQLYFSRDCLVCPDWRRELHFLITCSLSVVFYWAGLK